MVPAFRDSVFWLRKKNKVEIVPSSASPLSSDILPKHSEFRTKYVPAAKVAGTAGVAYLFWQMFSNFFQVRGIVNLLISRIDLVGMGVCAVLMVLIWSINSKRIWVRVGFSVALAVVAIIAIDRIAPKPTIVAFNRPQSKPEPQPLPHPTETPYDSPEKIPKPSIAKSKPIFSPTPQQCRHPPRNVEI